MLINKFLQVDVYGEFAAVASPREFRTAAVVMRLSPNIMAMIEWGRRMADVTRIAFIIWARLGEKGAWGWEWGGVVWGGGLAGEGRAKLWY